MAETVACPSCGKALKASREAVGRKVRCASCGESFTLADTAFEDESGLSTDFNMAQIRVTRDNTLSRSMIPGSAAPIVPQDELLGRIEPDTLRWLSATEALEAFLGLPMAQLRARRFPEFLHPDDRALAQDEFRKSVERGERHDFVLRFPERGGRIRYVRVYTQARYNPDGSLHHIRCYLKDVTERVQAEEELRRRTEQLTAANEQLRESNRKLKEAQGHLVHTEKLASLGTLAAGMAHEINNPLAFAMNNVVVLRREVGDLLGVLALYKSGLEALRGVEPELAERIEQHQNDVDLAYVQANLPRMTESTLQGLQRVAKIVENLRGFAQLDRLEIALIDVNEALEQSLAMVAGPIAQHRVTVEKRFEALPLLECAAAPMNQVFLNLLMNAVQAVAATGRGSGVVRVSTRTCAGEIIIEVSDDGVGIPPTALPHVFDPFFTTKPIGQGTGLGLSISHGIVAEHGGRIEVESRAGAGATFRVRLPLERAVKRD